MKINKIISFICAFCLLLCVVLSTIDFWCFNRDFYQNEYSKLNTASEIKISEEDLDKATDVLLSYLKDKNKTLDISANINGVNREIFNDREKAHMVDVRDLYLNVITLRNISFFIYLICMFVLAFRKDFSYLYLSYKKAFLAFGFIFLMIGIFCLIDFDGFWLNFHYIFFPDNDLWLLNPKTDILIMMVPEKFFFDLCISIVSSIVILLFGFMFIIKYLDKKVFNHD